jgi:hypothetical protein
MLTLFLLASVLTLVFLFNALQEPEFIIETRRHTYCFQGYLKFIFCISVIVFLPALLYIAYIGHKIQKNKNAEILIGKVKAFILALFFFVPLITITVSFVVASSSCS